MRRSTAIRVGAFVLVAAAAITAVRVLPVNEYLGGFLEWVRGLGWWGPIALIAAYIVATVLFVPGTVLTLGGGFVFGVVKGSIIISIGSTLGALAAFLIGRFAARDMVARHAAASPRFAAIDRAVADRGFRIVLLTRLSPLFPFNVLNYLFSITRVRTRDYLLGSWIGMMPGTIMYVYIGSAVKSLTQLVGGEAPAAGGWQKTAMFILGGVATIAVTVYVTIVAKRAMAAYVPVEHAGPDATASRVEPKS